MCGALRPTIPGATPTICPTRSYTVAINSISKPTYDSIVLFLQNTRRRSFSDVPDPVKFSGWLLLRSGSIESASLLEFPFLSLLLEHLMLYGFTKK